MGLALTSSHSQPFDLLRRDLLTLTTNLDTLLSLGTLYTKKLEDEDPLTEILKCNKLIKPSYLLGNDKLVFHYFYNYFI